MKELMAKIGRKIGLIGYVHMAILNTSFRRLKSLCGGSYAAHIKTPLAMALSFSFFKESSSCFVSRLKVSSFANPEKVLY
jgi:hypothetical protein